MPKFSSKLIMTFFVILAVGLNVLSAITLKILADQLDVSAFVLLIGVGMVIVINALRMVVWHFANTRYPLNIMYPLTSLFYPVMLLVSYLFGEKITFFQVLGTFFITLGVLWLGWRINPDETVV